MPQAWVTIRKMQICSAASSACRCGRTGKAPTPDPRLDGNVVLDDLVIGGTFLRRIREVRLESLAIEHALSHEHAVEQQLANEADVGFQHAPDVCVGPALAPAPDDLARQVTRECAT